MSDSCTFDVYFHKVFVSIINRFFNRIWNFFGFTKSVSYCTVSVTNNDKCSKSKSSTTLNNFSNTTDINDYFFKFFFYFLIFHHASLKLNASFSKRISK